MPRIRFLTDVTGVFDNPGEGDVRDVTPEEAQVWADGKRAEYVTAEQSEKTARRSRGGGRGPQPETRLETREG